MKKIADPKVKTSNDLTILLDNYIEKISNVADNLDTANDRLGTFYTQLKDQRDILKDLNSYIDNYVKAVKLNPEIKKAVKSGKIKQAQTDQHEQTQPNVE